MKGPGVGGMDGGVGVEVGSPLFQTVYLPAQVTDVPREVVRAFSHNKRVGTYLLGRSLGEGSFARVKEALHLPTGEKVAVKVIDKKRAKADPYVRKNLRREGRLLQQVRHPHVVQLFEVLETEHSYYIVTECCAGGDLMDHIAKRKKLEEREVKKFIRQIVSAVDYLHRLGIIHRDLKIENLLLDQKGDIKIIDFGLSNTIKMSTAPEGTAHAQEYLVTQCGSPAYAAPELLNHRKYGLQVDVWSIGVNMFAMLTGTLPFTVDPFNIKTLYNKMMSGQMNPIPDTLSREGKDLLKKFLTADPEKRVTISEALSHPWLAEARNKPLERHPFPNKLKTSDLDIDILKHMSENLGFRMSEVIRFVVGNVPSSACATYHMFHRKLQRHRAEQRAKGKTPAAEVRHVEPTRISLVLQDMTPRMTNHSGPGPVGKALRMRGDSVEKEAVNGRDVHAPRRKSPEKARLGLTTVSADKESIVVKEKTFLSSREQSFEDLLSDVKENSERSTSRSTSKQTHLSPPGTGNSTRNPRMISPTKAAQRAPASQQHQPGVGNNRQDHGGRQSRVTPGATHRNPGTVAAGTPPRMTVGDGRRGRMLVPLGKSLGGTPGRRAAVGAGGGGRVQGATFAGSTPAGSGPTSPRVDGTCMLRATYPAPSGEHSANTTSSPSPAPVPAHHVVVSSRYVPNKRMGNVQWRTAVRAETEVPVNGVSETHKHAADSKDAHSKRPVSPPVVPLVRRRLTKRSRQDGLHQTEPLSQGLGEPGADGVVDESVTVERLAASPDCRASSRAASASQSGQSSPARDLHLLPVLSPAMMAKH
ncbi:hypothetical protein BaRGS_00017437 [Batillaria attramentaria]|uniref:non-specific serine/threonine protein kinase n=1 Tax=Batillaria attramentaria TaxID=370345 RepID=A0ABD0KVL1_9CAEN